MEYEINDFFQGVEPRIMQRGRDYYHRNMVKDLQKSGREFTAKVLGSEYRPYHVEIGFDENGEVEDWECDCPYDWGDVCKHVVAVLLAIEQNGYEEQTQPEQQPDASKDHVTDLVSQADAELLKSLILDHCKKDQSFRLEVLSILGAPGQEELAAVKKLIKTSVKKHCRGGYYDSPDYDAVCQDVEDSLEKVRRRMERKEYPLALDILRYLLTACVELLHEAYDESDLPDSIDQILDLMKTCTSSMAEHAEADELRRQLDSILAAANSNDADEWEDFRYDLLQCAAPLADKQSVEKIYHLLEKWDASSGSEYYIHKNKEIHYYISSVVDGPETARAYLEQNLDVDALRITAVQQDMEQKNYTNAERLCLEKLESKKDYYHPGRWNYLLYEIYEQWGNREKQVQQARQMVLCGDWSYYKIYKEAMLTSGQWEKEYPTLRDQVRTVRPIHEYMHLLSDEQETDLLMEQVRLYPDTVFRYGSVIVSQYREEVYALCIDQVRERAKPTANRKQYQELCHMILLLRDFGGQKEAAALIDELAQAYPRRRALLEELKKARTSCF